TALRDPSSLLEFLHQSGSERVLCVEMAEGHPRPASVKIVRQTPAHLLLMSTPDDDVQIIRADQAAPEELQRSGRQEASEPVALAEQRRQSAETAVAPSR